MLLQLQLLSQQKKLSFWVVLQFFILPFSILSICDVFRGEVFLCKSFRNETSSLTWTYCSLVVIERLLFIRVLWLYWWLFIRLKIRFWLVFGKNSECWLPSIKNKLRRIIHTLLKVSPWYWGLFQLLSKWLQKAQYKEYNPRFCR